MKEIFSVCGINEYVSKMFQGDMLLSDVSVRGEISNCKYHSSGHVYFTLKDDKSTIDCILFASYKRNLSFKLENGMEIVARGCVDTYVKTGRYHLNVRTVENAGDGEIARRLAELKEKFLKLGMFDEKYKQPLPRHPKKIGVVTSPTGAAVWDLIRTAKKRNPYVSIILYPAIVQGDKAKESISRGIEALEEYGVDVIIIGRGGGSLEELWAFNEEMVAYAIFNCSVPVISAVGHETDFMVADLVADLRVSTPTQAMMHAIGEISAVDEQLDYYKRSFQRCMENSIHKNRLKAERLKGRLEQKSPKARITEYKSRSGRSQDRLNRAMGRIMEQSKHRLSLYIERMKIASPLERLSQGLAYVSDGNDRRISAVSGLEIGQNLNIRLRDGKIVSKIEEIIPEKENV